jgi:hypothetical protein
LNWRSSEPWSTRPSGDDFAIEPGKPIRLELHARLRGSQAYPLPIPTLELSRPDGELAFRNHAIEFYPFRVVASKGVSVSRAASPPIIDGQLEASWRDIASLDAFVDVQGAERPSRKVRVKLAHAAGRLYLHARMDASPSALERGVQPGGQENANTLRDDSIRVLLAAGDAVYSFAVNSRGALVDMKGKDLKWSSDFQAAASPAPHGWQAELSIPLANLDSTQQGLRLNIVRQDPAARSVSELFPTFGRSDLDHHVPQYASDDQAIQRFAPLTLE